jgi:hypothetical protein
MERLMRITVEERYMRGFNNVLTEQGISDPEIFMDVDWFDEFPVYSYFDQLGYLSSLPFIEANRILIRCSVLYLERIAALAIRHGRVPGKTILRMISVTGWQNENDERQRNYNGAVDFVQPYIWRANLDHPGLRDFSLHPITSPAGRFTRDAVSGDDRFAVAEGRPDKFGQPSPERVDIYMPGSEGTERLKFRDD